MIVSGAKFSIVAILPVFTPSLTRQRSVLSQELDENVKAQKQLSLDWESLRLQQEEQLRKEQEVAGELKQKSRKYRRKMLIKHILIKV